MRALKHREKVPRETLLRATKYWILDSNSGYLFLNSGNDVLVLKHDLLIYIRKDRNNFLREREIVLPLLSFLKGLRWILEKAMATHSSTLAWQIPWMEEPGRLQSMGSLGVGLSNFTFTFHFHVLEKEMATHFSVLAWRIPGMGEPGGLPCLGSNRVRHNWSELAPAAADEFCIKLYTM